MSHYSHRDCNANRDGWTNQSAVENSRNLFVLFLFMANSGSQINWAINLHVCIYLECVLKALLLHEVLYFLKNSSSTFTDESPSRSSSPQWTLETLSPLHSATAGLQAECRVMAPAAPTSNKQRHSEQSTERSRCNPGSGCRKTLIRWNQHINAA